VSSWHSLLACTQADVTLERITSLVATTGTEPLTVDFKEKATPRLAECVASMANAHGGLILVGITDADRKVVGVKTETMAHVADMLTTRLDPADWLPEMFEVPLGDDHPGRHILVIRIRRELAPSPVLVQRTVGSGEDKTSLFWTPVRIPGGTRQATRAEMAALFAEQSATTVPQPGQWDFEAPHMPSGKDGLPDEQVDMMLKTGLRVPPGPACPGRPLSERAISELATVLDKSPIAEVLFGLTGLASTGIYGTHRRGRPNTSGTATLVWQIADGQVPPFEMTVRVESPGQYGHTHIQTLNVTIEITSRLTAWRSTPTSPLPPPPGTLRYLEAPEWAALLDAMMATLTDPRVITVIADLSDVDPILVPPPRVLHLVSNREIAGFLPPQLRPIPDASGSHEAHLQADPSLSLAEEQDRGRQVARWLCQIAADAGLAGMEHLAAQLPSVGG
jgi:Putative DNA-binding domain